LKVAL